MKSNAAITLDCDIPYAEASLPLWPGGAVGAGVATASSLSRLPRRWSRQGEPRPGGPRARLSGL